MPLEGPHQFKCVRLFIRVSKCTQDARQMQIAQLMYRGSTTCAHSQWNILVEIMGKCAKID